MERETCGLVKLSNYQKLCLVISDVARKGLIGQYATFGELQQCSCQPKSRYNIEEPWTFKEIM